MSIDGVQEGSPGDAIGSATAEPGGIHRAGIAADDVVSSAARVIDIVDSELSMIENIKSLSPELKFTGLADLEMFQHRQIEVGAPRIIEDVPAGIAEGEPPRSHKLGRIADERAKASRIVAGRRQSMHNVGVGGGDAEPTGDAGIVGHGNAGVAS